MERHAFFVGGEGDMERHAFFAGGEGDMERHAFFAGGEGDMERLKAGVLEPSIVDNYAKVTPQITLFCWYLLV